MKDGRCLKNYPKEFHVATTVDENSFAIYKRSDNQHFIIKGVLNWIIVG
jgi:hypothetical protein